MSRLLRGLLLGAGFGLAAGTTSLWLGLIGTIVRRFGMSPTALLETLCVEVALGAGLGLIASPLLGLRRGVLWHVGAVAAIWAGLVKWVEVDIPMVASTQYVPVVASLVLLALGYGIGRRRIWLPVGLGLLLMAGGLAAPSAYLALTAAESPPQVASAPPPPAGAPDVVLIVLDTVRAQNLSTYGYARPTAPTLDALAGEGALFLDATSPSTWSLPSHASLFTGAYPSRHGAHSEHRYLDQRLPTLAQVLGRSGYDTFCFTANGWISDGLGLTRGFGWQDPTAREGGAGRLFSFAHRLLERVGFAPQDKGGGQIVAHFGDWVRERPAGSRPVFVFLNFIEAHFPYHQLPDEYRDRFTDRSAAELRAISMALMGRQFGGELADPQAALEPALDMYDGGVLYSDHLLELVVAALRERGTLDRTLLIVLGDHGELLGERGDYFGHGPGLYQQVVHVPLLVRYPPAVPAGVRVETPVSTLGVYATILDVIGLELPPTLQVGSLLPVIEGGEGGGPILAELHDSSAMAGGVSGDFNDPMMDARARHRLYREGRWKLVESSNGRVFLYDVVADPGETRNLAGAQPAELARMRAALEEVKARLGLPALDAELDLSASPELDPATRERLRQLGYTE